MHRTNRPDWAEELALNVGGQALAVELAATTKSDYVPFPMQRVIQNVIIAGKYHALQVIIERT